MNSLLSIGSAVASPLLYNYVKPSLTAAVTVAKVGGALTCAYVGYKAACATYQSEFNTLHNYLWLNRGWEMEDAEKAVNAARTVTTLVTFAASFIPLYLAVH